MAQLLQRVRQKQQQQQQQHQTQKHHRHKPHDPAVKRVCAQLAAEGSRQQTQAQTAGTCLFAALVFAAGAAPASLPWLFVAWAAVCLPWRAHSFMQQKWGFFLLDFCYFVNVAAVVFLLFPDHPGLEALLYSLADGPLAGALVAWQCPWVFGSAEHTTSVLMHLLPGLSLFMHRHHTPSGLRGWRGLAATAGQLLQGRSPDLGAVSAAQQPTPLSLWLCAAPLAFYVAWQLVYFLVVQVVCRGFILRHGYDTSYTCLARRAAKTNNIWNRLVRHGSINRRVCMYGALQLAFTVISCSVFLPTYFCYWAAVALQLVKLAFSVHYGSRYQCCKVPQHTFLRGMQLLEADKHKQQQLQHAHAHDQAAAAEPCSPSRRAVVTAAAALCLSCQSLQRRSCAAEVAASAGSDCPATLQLQPALVM